MEGQCCIAFLSQLSTPVGSQTLVIQTFACLSTKNNTFYAVWMEGNKHALNTVVFRVVCGEGVV